MGSHSYLQNMAYCSGSACNQMHYLQVLPSNFGQVHTAGLLNSHASKDTITNVGKLVGDRTSVITLSELNWITDAAAKAKAAAEAAAAKAKAAEAALVQKVKDDIAATEAAIAALPQHIKDRLAADLAKAKAAAAKFAQITEAEALAVIGAATAAAKAEGSKLANELFDDLEAEGHVLSDEAKAKVLALSIEIGQDVSDKIGEAEQGIDAVLDSKKNVFTRSIIEYIESQGQHLTEEGQEKVVALAAILEAQAEGKIDQVDNIVDDFLDDHRPTYLLI